VADPSTGGLGGPWATERTIFQKVKDKQWALAGEEVAMQSSDGSISGFQFRYDNDTIFTKYRDIDTISISFSIYRYITI
jgi:hypothetical protein